MSADNETGGNERTLIVIALCAAILSSVTAFVQFAQNAMGNSTALLLAGMVSLGILGLGMFACTFIYFARVRKQSNIVREGHM